MYVVPLEHNWESNIGFKEEHFSQPYANTYPPPTSLPLRASFYLSPFLTHHPPPSEHLSIYPLSLPLPSLLPPHIFLSIPFHYLSLSFSPLTSFYLSPFITSLFPPPPTHPSIYPLSLPLPFHSPFSPFLPLTPQNKLKVRQQNTLVFPFWSIYCTVDLKMLSFVKNIKDLPLFCTVGHRNCWTFLEKHYKQSSWRGSKFVWWINKLD